MIYQIFSAGAQPLLNMAMDAASIRNDIISDNMANVDTPGFKRRELIFEKNIKKVLENTTISDKLKVNNARHMQVMGKKLDKIEPQIVVMNQSSYRNDANNVDIDVETAKLAKNKITYDALSQSMSNEFHLLRLAITGRG